MTLIDVYPDPNSGAITASDTAKLGLHAAALLGGADRFDKILLVFDDAVEPEDFFANRFVTCTDTGTGEQGVVQVTDDGTPGGTPLTFAIANNASFIAFGNSIIDNSIIPEAPLNIARQVGTPSIDYILQFFEQT